MCRGSVGLKLAPKNPELFAHADCHVGKLADLFRNISCDHSLRGAGEAEGRALGVATDHPAIARVDDLAAERSHPLDRGSEVGYGEIREREAVAGTGAALVQPENDPLVPGLPATPFLGPTTIQRRL
jgi:hypothetical protein